MSKENFANSGKTKFLDTIPIASLDSENDTLIFRCKFNFSYFEKQDVGKGFEDISNEELIKIIEKIKEYGRESLKYWRNQPVGKQGAVFTIYGAFPKKSQFKHPKHVPHQVEWGRFRLDWSTRLCGFTVPQKYHGKSRVSDGSIFCSNTFYVVFLDPEHKFYQSEPK
jgi:hypothetical protein